MAANPWSDRAVMLRGVCCYRPGELMRGIAAALHTWRHGDLGVVSRDVMEHAPA